MTHAAQFMIHAGLTLTMLCALSPVLPAFSRENVSYGRLPEQTLDIRLPDAPGTNRPAVLMFHGGSWKGGDKSTFAKESVLFAAAGIVAIPVSYRLTDGSPQNTWPAQLQDAQLAMRWVRAHAAEFGIDEARICAYGNSAGGHLAVFLGVLGDIFPGDQDAELPHVSPRARCVVAVSSPVDLLVLLRKHKQVAMNLLGSRDESKFAPAAEAASPVRRVGRDTAPMLLVYGQQDPVVPVAQGQAMYDALRRNGVPAWLMIHSGGHVRQGLTQPARIAIRRSIIDFVKDDGLPTPPGVTNLP